MTDQTSYTPTPVRDNVLTDAQCLALRNASLGARAIIRAMWKGLEDEEGQTTEAYTVPTNLLLHAHGILGQVSNLLGIRSQTQELAQLRAERDDAQAELTHVKAEILSFGDRIAEILETAYEALPPLTDDQARDVLRDVPYLKHDYEEMLS